MRHLFGGKGTKKPKAPKLSADYFFTFLLFSPFLRLQVGILTNDVLDAGAVLPGVQVVVSHDQGAGVAPMKVLKEPSQRGLLRLGAGVGGLTADVEPALVADAYRVGVVVHAVGTDHIFRTAVLDFSVTTDDVVGSYRSPVALFSMP